MPDSPPAKARPHPSKRPAQRASPARRAAGPAYAELAVTTNFTFLTGASHPDEFVARAAELGHSAAAVADVNSLAGAVRAHVAAKDAGIPLAVGVRLRFNRPPGLEALVFPTDRAAYARLCRLLTLGKRRSAKAQCDLTVHDFLEHADGLLAVLIPPRDIGEDFIETAQGLASILTADRLSLGAVRAYAPDDLERLDAIDALARRLRVPLAAINDAHHHVPGRRPLQDVLTCVRHGCAIDAAGFRLHANAERHLKPPEEMARLFASRPAALERSAEIARRASAFSLDQLRYEYPDEDVPPGSSPMRHLRELARAGALQRYPAGVPDKVAAQIEHEMALIEELRYAPYFLTCREIVAFARSRGILCQGRGAAANSAVCYCLGVTSVDPERVDVLFERFVSRERNEPPDIDIDFEHERREEVIQHIYERYGRERAALTAEVITYQPRSAVRDVGKALGLSLDCVDRLARTLDWWDRGAVSPARLRELGFDPADPTLRRLAALTAEILGFPRHLSQHVGGFVITRGPLCESVPIENAAMPDRTVIEWDKDDLDALGMLKIDILGLGMLTCIRKAFDLAAPDAGGPLTLAGVPAEDPAVYDMLCEADSVGVFQVESRAQMSMLPRLRPRCFYDLVIEVAIVRPGPIQGDMVHPYLRRRNHEEPVSFPHPDVERVLAKTLGVPLFQEQVMQLAIVAAGFSPGEADALRRAMAAWKRKGDALRAFEGQFIGGMLQRGYPREFAERCFEQVRGFSEYGFPESHAASFALLVYVSAWLKRRHPAAFAAALLNSQPMGFYAPAQIVRDARDHGVRVLPIDVNHSAWDCALEREPAHDAALRLGTRLVKGLAQRDADALADAVARRGPFPSIDALRRAAPLPVGALRRLAQADAFQSMGLDRQRALWAVRALRDERLPLFEHADTTEPDAALPEIALDARVRHDYDAAGLSLKAHPMAALRERLDAAGASPAGDLRDEAAWPHGTPIRVAGVVTCRQRPSTASGVVFITLEDETGFANLIVRPRVYERFRAAARHSVILLAAGRVERQGPVVHVHTRTLRSLDDPEAALLAPSRNFH
ncbi:MAG: error-prone DNA polymerase [Phycisphaerales bacterium]|nr:error-prone DNA polymerase [Phycisphaerales bacterium]